MNDLARKLYYLSIFLLLIPSISFPFFSSAHTLGGYILLILFFFLAPKIFLKGKINIDKKLAVIFLLFFISQSISVIGALNISAFISSFIDLIFSAVLIFLSFYFINSRKDLDNVIKVLVLMGIVNIIFQTFILLFPDSFYYLGQLLINKDYLSSVSADISRGRIAVADYNEILIPIIAYFWIKNEKKIYLLPFFFLISVFSFLSNFRTKVLMLFFASVFSVLFLFKDRKKYLVFVLIVPVIFYLLYISQDYSVVNRLLLENRADVATITGRFDRWSMAFDMGLSSPLIGVGLGNYYDYLPPQFQKSYSSNSLAREEFNSAATDPHNIFFREFAETGVLGLSAFILLFLFFAKQDFYTLKTKNLFSKSLIISFWTLFIFSVFNPTGVISYSALFWVLRVLISRSINLSS